MELGTLLKKARQEKELTLADIQERTKIRKKYLEAIEANNFDILPGKVYLKVFVKGYAREVDINYQELLNYYPVLKIKEEKSNTLHKDYLDGTKISHKANRNKNRKKSIFKIIFIAIAALFLIAAAAYTFQYFSDSEIRLLNQNNSEEQLTVDQGAEIVESEESDTENNDEQITANDQAETDENTILEELTLSSNQSNNQNDLLNSINPDLSANENSEIISQNELNNMTEVNNLETNTAGELDAAGELIEPEAAVTNDESQIAADNLETDQSSSNNLETSQNINDSGDQEEEEQELTEVDKTIVFRANNTVWVNVRLDGESAFSGILEDGDSREFEVNDELYIKIGNASAITALVNGEERGPWGGAGGIVELEFVPLEDEIEINNLRE